MLKFLKSWFKDAIWYALGSYIPLFLILTFGMFAVNYWPDYAWGSTACFALVTLLVVFFLIWKKK